MKQKQIQCTVHCNGQCVVFVLYFVLCIDAVCDGYDYDDDEDDDDDDDDDDDADDDDDDVMTAMKIMTVIMMMMMMMMMMVESLPVGKTETAMDWWTTKQRVTGHG